VPISDNIEQTPPHSREAERSVLGALLRDNRVIGDVMQILWTECFYPDTHQKIFAAMVSLYDAGKPVDMTSLAELLNDRGQIKDIGGYVYIGDLLEAAPTGANALYHARIVRDRFIVRSLIYAGTDIVRDAYGNTMPPDELLASAERAVLDISQMGREGEVVTLGQAAGEACDEIDARSLRYQSDNSSVGGITTGFYELDYLTGGLRGSELVVIASRPGGGKTAFGLGVAHHVAVRTGKPVFFASLEMNRKELAERMMCNHGSIDSHKVRRGSLSDAEVNKLTAAHQAFLPVGVYIDDRQEQSMLRIGANARRLKAKHKIELVIVDYLQLIIPDDRRAPRHEQVSAISRRLKFLARELDVPVLAMAQLNRQVEDRQGQRPRLSDLRESGGIEADADMVILLHRPNNGEPTGDVEDVTAIVAKQRHGPVGDVLLKFEKRFIRFENPEAVATRERF